MRIDELFNSDINGKVIKRTESLFVTSAEVGNRVIRFSADMYAPAEWEIVFIEQSTKGDTFGVSGSGNELQVFSFVVDSIKLFVSMYTPEKVFFTSSASDGNRSKLYARMMKRISIPGYTGSATTDPTATGDRHFQIIKDK